MWSIVGVAAAVVVMFLVLWKCIHDVTVMFNSKWRDTKGPLFMSVGLVLIPGSIAVLVMTDRDWDRRAAQREEQRLEQQREEICRVARKDGSGIHCVIGLAGDRDAKRCKAAAAAYGFNTSRADWRMVLSAKGMWCRTPEVDCIRENYSDADVWKVREDCDAAFEVFSILDYIAVPQEYEWANPPRPEASDYDDGSDAGDDDFSYSYDGDSYDPDEFVPYDNGWEIVECPEDVWGDEPCG